MRYSYVLASLTASAVATPFIDLHITESRDTHRHGTADRVLRWFSAMWGGPDQNGEGPVSVTIPVERLTSIVFRAQ